MTSWALIYLVLINRGYSSKVFLSRKITNNITWLMSELNTKPVTRYNYDFTVEFPTENCCPLFSVYSTHRDYAKLECFGDRATGEIVWLKNYMHKLDPKANTGNRDYDGSVASCTEKRDIIQCDGKFRLQDFEPKKRDFIFGFLCKDLHSKNLSLRGLTYNITVSDETNVVTCEAVDHSRCSKHSNFATFPNVFGDYSQIRASFTFDTLMGMVEKSDDTLCYKYIEKAICTTTFPPCLNVSVSSTGERTTQTVYSICRETCEEFGSSCSAYLGEAFVKIIYCSYFQYKEHSDTCYYEKVNCSEPDLVSNGHYNTIDGNINSSFFAGTTIEYICNEGYQLEGSKNSTCLLSGEWSSKSECTSISTEVDSNFTATNTLLFIGIPLLILVVCLLSAFVILLTKHKRSKKTSRSTGLRKRNKEADAFVSYYSEDSHPDQNFVKKVLCPKLELEQEDPFKLIIHERDFRAGTNIVTNIMNAIQNSNSAIILLSQDYVNSRWCRDEFEWCVEESKKDPAYELYVILMDPERKLTGLSDYMEQYLGSITYLKLTDPGLLKKIVEELSKIRTDECVEMIATSQV